MPDLSILWACLSAAEPSATTACFDGELLAALLKAGWLTGNGVLQETSCPSCGRGGLSVFTEFPDSDDTEYAAYCGECGVVPLARENATAYVFEPSAIAAFVAAAIGMRNAPEEVEPGRLWRLGQTRLRGRPVFAWATRGLHWSGRFRPIGFPRFGRNATILHMDECPAGFHPPPDCGLLLPLGDYVELENGAFFFDTESFREAVPLLADTAPSRSPARKSRADRTAMVKAQLKEELRNMKDVIWQQEADGAEIQIPPRPKQKQIAQMLGLSEAAVSRILNGADDLELKRLWEGLLDPELVARR